MKTTKWAHLPNAKHIDWVIASVKANPDAWSAAWNAAYDAARHAVWDAASDVAYVAAKDSILALVTYDDCEKYLDMTPDELQVWAVLSNDPAAILLQPMVQVMQKEAANLAV